MEGQRRPTSDRLDARGLEAALHERAAFGLVYDAAVRPVYAFCLAHSDDVSDADDLLAQTFVRALARLDAYDARTSPLVWLLTIAAEGAWERPTARHGDASIEAAGGVVDAAPGDHPPGTTPVEAVARWERAAEPEPRTPPAGTPRRAADLLDDLRVLRRGLETAALAPDPATVADLRALVLDETMSPGDLLDLNDAYAASRYEEDVPSTARLDDDDGVFVDEDGAFGGPDGVSDRASRDDPLFDAADPTLRAGAKAAGAVRQLKRDVRGLPAPALSMPLTVPASSPRALDRTNVLVLVIGALLTAVIVLLVVVVVLLVRR